MTIATDRPALLRSLAIGALALALAACGGAPAPVAADPATRAGDAEDRADRAREAARTDGTADAVTVPEAFATPMTPEDNIDSVASWTGPDGRDQVFAVASFATVRDGLVSELTEVWTDVDQQAPDGTRPLA